MNKLSLNLQILVGTVAGVGLGWWMSKLGQESATAQHALYIAKLIGTLFIDLLRMVFVPLVFTSITVGVANLRLHKQMNRVWPFTLLYFIATMMIAVLLGLTVANLVQPGSELQVAMFQNEMQNFQATQMSLPNRKAPLGRFPRRDLYEPYGLYKPPMAAGWNSAHASA